MEYKTVSETAHENEALLIEKKSKFHARAKQVSTQEEAQDFIAQIKQKHSTATHNVFAYRINAPFTERASDDGEPHQTAGLPMLTYLQKENITNICVVVTRYYGGTQLGTGGLTRAYSGACKACVSPETVTMKQHTICHLTFDYPHQNTIAHYLTKNAQPITQSTYTDKIALELHILTPAVPKIQSDLIELTQNNLTFTQQKTLFKGTKH